MRVSEIKRKGYFDDVGIDGWVEPIYKSTGVIIHNGMSFEESINFNETDYSMGIAHLHLDIFGEVIPIREIDSDEIRERNKLNLPKTVKLGIERYRIAYADILLIKDDYSMPDGVYNTGKDIETFGKLAQGKDELDLFRSALKMIDYISRTYGNRESSICGAVVDKVYVVEGFRRDGISSWLHSNLSSIINTFSLVYPSFILLAYGDFKGEAAKKFGMTPAEYSKMLKKHYTELKYKELNSICKCRFSGYSSNILCKIII